MLWIDEYSPKLLHETEEIHPSVFSQLKRLTQARNVDALPHIIFYGPSGGGKITRVYAILRKLYGRDKIDKTMRRTLMASATDKNHEFRICQSSHHFHISAGDFSGSQDKQCLQGLFKELANSQQIQSTSSFLSTTSSSSTMMTTMTTMTTTTTMTTEEKKSKNHAHPQPQQQQQQDPEGLLDLEEIDDEKGLNVGYKILVISDADNLSIEAQSALRRTIEKSVVQSRIMITSNSLTGIIEPIRSRCLCIRVPSVPETKILNVLEKIANKENLKIPSLSSTTMMVAESSYLKKIANSSNGNLRVAILQLQSSSLKKFPKEIITQPWKNIITIIIGLMLSSNSQNCLMECRENLYILLVACIPGQFILERLYEELIYKNTTNISDAKKLEISRAASLYSLSIQKGSKDIYHLEAWISRCLLILSSPI